MADYQRVTEFLRDVRQGAGSGGLQTVNDEIAHMAAEYAALCVAANDRLRKCSGFLQQGLRTEAIHLAEESPNLLDLIAQLDLPDPQSWAEFCQNNGFPVPPALQLERAAQLNEAYAQDQPLEHLMARHRLLALSRAPVRERLDVMRKIAQLDAVGGHWEKDLRIFEQARLKELPSAFYNAVKNHDSHAISGLMEELNGQTWYEAPPADLLAAVSQAHARVQRSSVEAELRKLVEPLREAFAAHSVQECQALVQRWKNVMASGGVTNLSGELTDEIRPVVAFIAEQTKRDDYLKRYHEACKAFARMLDADAVDAQLEAAYARLKEFKEEIPEDLTRRYMAKRTGRRQDADRSHKVRLLTIAGVFGVILVICLGVGWLLLRSSNADKWAREINDAVAQHTREGLQQGQKRVDDLKANNPALLKEPEVAKAASALQVAQAKYDTDAASVTNAAAKIERLRQAAAQVMARPDAAMEEIRSSAGELDAAINEAGETLKQVEWADPDGKLRGAIAGAQTIRRSMQERVIQVAAAEIKAINAAVDAVPQATTTPEAALQAQNELTVLADRAGKLAALPLLDPATKADIGALSDRIAKRRQGADASGGIAEELQKVRTMAGSAAELRTALSGFSNRFPADPRTAEFKMALHRLAAAESLEAWQAKLAAYQGNMAPTSLTDAQKRLDDVTTFLAAHPEFPRTEEVTPYGDYLKRAVDALGDAGPWQTGLTPLVTNPLISELDYIDVSDGRRFYVLGDPKRTEHKMNNQITSVSFDAVDLTQDAGGNFHLYRPKGAATSTAASTSGNRPSSDEVPNTITITISQPLHVADSALPTPAKKAAAEIVESLKLIDEKNWDTYGIDLADRLARNDALDVVIKAILLQQALKTEVAVTGGQLGDAYDKTIAALARQKPEVLPFPDPSKIPDGTRRSIKAIIDEMPAGAAVKQRLTGAKAVLFKAIMLDAMNSGVLLKNDTDAWVVYSRATPVNGAVVLTIVPAADAVAAGPTKLITVGTTADGQFVLNDAALKNVPQGSIVFITRK